MKIVHISDTHGKHKEIKNLPEADIIIHSGDFTANGTEEEAYDFMNWLCDLPYKNKIFISGNHDECMFGADNIDGLPDDVHYLCNTSLQIEGLKFYGIPLFNEDVMNGQQEIFYDMIPQDTDMLITHEPPRGMCDLADYGYGLENRGNDYLMKRVIDLQPRYHFFGHEHSAYGAKKQEGIIFSNASILNEKMKSVNKPKLFLIK